MKDRNVYIVFQGDAQLTVCSYVLMGVFGTVEKAVHAVIKEGEFDSDWLESQGEDAMEYVEEYLIENLQTPQCGQINYIIKEVPLNIWGEIN